jgi:photosystem II stability/assembly factor-like uncharacterized protein
MWIAPQPQACALRRLLGRRLQCRFIARSHGLGAELFVIACLRTALAAAILLVIGLDGRATAAVADVGHWVAQDPGTAGTIYRLSCPTTSTCYAAVSQGTIVGTTDGGHDWTGLLAGAQSGVQTITCPSASRCITGSEQAFNILLSRDDGRTWDLAYQPDFASPDSFDSSGGYANYYYRGLYGATCATARVCYLVGTVGHIYRSLDGGASWAVVAGEYSSVPPASGTSRQSVLSDISCTDASTCFAVGVICYCVAPSRELAAGEIAISTDGGATWRSRTIANVLYGVSCPAARTCVAVGAGGTILRTSDGGRSWPRVPTPLRQGQADLNAVTCESGVCRAVGGGANGQGGVVLWSGDAGRTWRIEPLPEVAALYTIACPRADLCYLGGRSGVLLKGA